MTRDEVKKLLAIMTTTFPNYKIENVEQTIGTWQMLLDEYDANEIFLAFKGFVKNNNSGFAPSVSQLINQLEQPKDLAVMDVSEAWALVRRAIGRGSHYSKAEFEKLPPLVQKAVGSAEQIHLWAIDEDYNNEVVMSLFQKNYKTICERQRTYERLPQQLQTRVTQLIEQNTTKVNDNALLLGTKPSQVFVDEFVTEDSSKYMNRLGELLDGS